MAVLPVVKYGDPILRKKTKLVTNFNELESLINDMFDTMYEEQGIGLAANQIGILKQIITVQIQDKEKKSEKTYCLFNPNIIEFSKEKILIEEGCLSLPKQFAEIERPKSIVVRYTNEKNKIVEVEKNGMEARILQHEIDHLYGKLFVDYLSSLKRNILIKKVNKLKKMGEI